jgi:NTP pyrophosphatase (non-canonical NTP hydrolase)
MTKRPHGATGLPSLTDRRACMPCNLSLSICSKTRACAGACALRITDWTDIHGRMAILNLQLKLRDFAAERDWGQFHTPKNLVMALTGEVGELTEIFQWLSPEQSAAVLSDPVQAARVREELADVFAYLLRISDVLGIDLEQALEEKIAQNTLKYPVRLSRGIAVKYTELPGEEAP